jgi:nickel/cobalt exporter
MKRFTILTVAVLGVFLWPSAAAAHPLGKFSVNQAVALTFAPASVTASVAVDFAELPTLAARPTADLSGHAVCTSFASAFSVSGLRFALSSSSFAYRPGSAGLSTSRVTCTLSAPAALSAGSVLAVANGYMTDRVGWREITAAGSGLTLSTSLPSVSPSSFLLTYPSDLLSSPVDVRNGTVRIVSLSSNSSVAAVSAPGAVIGRGSSWTAGFEQRLDSSPSCCRFC